MKPQKVNKHQSAFVCCTLGIVYRILLSCDKQYIRQMGHCFNDRLREHCNGKKKLAGWMASHSL